MKLMSSKHIQIEITKIKFSWLNLSGWIIFIGGIWWFLRR
jgi:hypothetical protein